MAAKKMISFLACTVLIRLHCVTHRQTDASTIVKRPVLEKFKTRVKLAVVKVYELHCRLNSQLVLYLQTLLLFVRAATH